MPFKVLSSRLPNFQLLYQRLQVSLDPLLSTSPVQIAWIAQSISNCTGYLCLSRWTEPFLSRVSCFPIWLRTNAENAPLLLKYPKSEHVHESSLFSNAPRKICYKPPKHSKCCVHSNCFSPFNATVQPHWLMHLQVSSAYRPKQLGACTYSSCSQNAVKSECSGLPLAVCTAPVPCTASSQPGNFTLLSSGAASLPSCAGCTRIERVFWCFGHRHDWSLPASRACFCRHSCLHKGTSCWRATFVLFFFA